MNSASFSLLGDKSLITDERASRARLRWGSQDEIPRFGSALNPWGVPCDLVASGGIDRWPFARHFLHSTKGIGDVSV